jgi:ribosomal protein S18 acetylase RimI-like enzyme
VCGAIEHGRDALGSLGMTVPGQMIQVGLVGGEQNGHCSRRYRPCHMRSHALDTARLQAEQIVLDTEYGARARPGGVDPATAHLVVADHTVVPPVERVEAWVHDLHERGFRRIRTGALADEPTAVFGRVGFVVEQRLVLLRTDPRDRLHLVDGNGSTRRVRTAKTATDLTTAAEIDRAAFGPQWCIGETGILDACDATPSHRMRLVDTDAYAVTGRSHSAGFVQRLAVRPDAQHSGLGRRLMVDALEWLRRWRVATAMVNTHVENTAALALYASLGFTRLDEPLAVLALDLEPSA